MPNQPPAALFQSADRQLHAALAHDATGHAASQGLTDWLAMLSALPPTAMLDTAGASHLATFVRSHPSLANARLPRQRTAMLEDFDRIVAASLASGWAGADMPEILAAALDRADPLLLDRLLALPGVPAPAQWATIKVRALDAYARQVNQEPSLPAPCAWAAVSHPGSSRRAPLDWWLDHRFPLPPRILDHASPLTLDPLLAAGATPDPRTAQAWRARCKKGATQELSAADVATMLARVQEKAIPGQDVQELYRGQGYALLEQTFATRTAWNPSDLTRGLEAWRAGLPSARLPDFPPPKSWFFRRITAPVPWWSLALLNALNTWGMGQRTRDILDTWDRVAGPAPAFDPALPAAARDTLIGFALLSALVSGAKEDGVDYIHNTTKEAAARGGQRFDRIAAWAGLDGPQAWSCVARLLAPTSAQGRAVSTRIGTRISVALMVAMHVTLATITGTPDDLPRVAGLVEALDACTPGALTPMPTRMLAQAVSPAAAPALHPGAAIALGLRVLARSSVTGASAVPRDATIDMLVKVLKNHLDQGACVPPASLASLDARTPDVASLAQLNAMVAAQSVPATKPRRHA